MGFCGLKDYAGKKVHPKAAAPPANKPAAPPAGESPGKSTPAPSARSVPR